MTTNRNLSGECVITELSQELNFEREDFMDKLFDCKQCGGHCIRRRICCDGKGQCKLLFVLDEKILFWCGSENKSVTRKQYCEILTYAKTKTIVYGLRSNVFVSKFCKKSFRFHDHGETRFNWPKNEDF